jgi:hypothetical protein
MIAPVAVFTCSICGETSKDICILCTKDACTNHRCDRCKRCSDCCECDVPLSAEEVIVAAETPVPVPVPVVVEPTAAPLPEVTEAQTAATGDIPPYLPESFETPREPGE